MNKKSLLLALLLVVSYIAVFSQEKKNFSLFEQRTFYKPFVSEISSTLTNVSIGGVKNSIAGKYGETVFSEIHLGADIPLMYNENKFRWGVSIPISLHVLWATFGKVTAPIVNNDYRFGLSFTGISYINNKYIKNISFKVTPFAHESTHLGDELTIYGFQNINNFYRVNVSYEYYELGITLNDIDTIKDNNLSVRVGFMGLINPKKGYYSFFDNEIGDKDVYPSKRWAEYYMELEYTKTKGFLTTKSWHPSISVELRNRVKYEYEKQGKADRVWCINAFVGYEYTPRRMKGVRSVGHYFRYYDGLNPHGQFRNMYYRFVGYSIILFY